MQESNDSRVLHNHDYLNILLFQLPVLPIANMTTVLFIKLKLLINNVRIVTPTSKLSQWIASTSETSMYQLEHRA
jgi:hypothetical protein